METYRSKDFQKMLNVSKIQISNWVNRGCIIPYKEDRRRGGSHEFGRQNLIEAAICKELSDLQVPVVKIAEGLNTLRMVIPKDVWKNKESLGEFYLMYTSPLKFDYSKFPKFKESVKMCPSSDFKKTFVPMIVLEKDLVETLKFMRAGVVLGLKCALDYIG